MLRQEACIDENKLAWPFHNRKRSRSQSPQRRLHSICFLTFDAEHSLPPPTSRFLTGPECLTKNQEPMWTPSFKAQCRNMKKKRYGQKTKVEGLQCCITTCGGQTSTQRRSTSSMARDMEVRIRGDVCSTYCAPSSIHPHVSSPFAFRSTESTLGYIY